MKRVVDKNEAIQTISIADIFEKADELFYQFACIKNSIIYLLIKFNESENKFTWIHMQQMKKFQLDFPNKRNAIGWALSHDFTVYALDHSRIKQDLIDLIHLT